MQSLIAIAEKKLNSITSHIITNPDCNTKNFDFKKYPLEKRSKESARMREKYPNRVPLIINRGPNCHNIPDIKKHKFLVPVDLTAGQLMYILRQKMKLKPEDSIFMLLGKNYNMIPATSQIISSLYYDYKDEDGFLYIIYTGESTFG